jgi:hypothetical protein
MEEAKLLRFLGGLYDEIQALREALTECASDLECEIENRYGASKDHPAMIKKYEMDMEPVSRACRLIGKPRQAM